MHASLRQLLSLRDGAPVEADCRAHVAGCERCQRELGQLRDVTLALRRLPDPAAPKSAWAEVRARLEARGAGAGRAGPRAGGARAGAGGVAAARWRPRRGLGMRQALLEGALAGALAVLATLGLRFFTLDTELPGVRSADVLGGGAAFTYRQRGGGGGADGGTMPVPPAGSGQGGMQARLAAAAAAPVGGTPTRAAATMGGTLSPAVGGAPTLEQLLARVREQEAALARLERARDLARMPASVRLARIKERIALLDHYCLTGQDLSPRIEYQVMLQRIALMNELLAEYALTGGPRAVPASYQLRF